VCVCEGLERKIIIRVPELILCIPLALLLINKGLYGCVVVLYLEQQ